jgi:hypothetical protein
MSEGSNNANKKNDSQFLYRQYGKASSSLEASKEALSPVRKKMIRYALDLPVRDIRTYSGYKGDLLIEITTNEEVILPKLKDYAESLEMETVIKKMFDIRLYKIYCIVPDENIYQLKEPL